MLLHDQSISSAVPPDISTWTHMFVRNDAVNGPLTPSYTGPYRVLKSTPRPFTVDSHRKEEIVSIDKVDTERLQWIRHHQKEMRAEEYGNLRDEVNQNHQVMASDVGLPVILPSSCTRGPCYMHENMQVALTYACHCGCFDLFITFTCNPKWRDIQSHLFPGQNPLGRHDIILRVFHLKLKKMIDVIRHGQLSGPVRCFMYTVGWQKRGLPHAHILFWLQIKLMSTDVDSVISAELPNPQEDPVLFDIIKTNMMHGLCGYLNRNSAGMDNERCTKRYPRKLIHEMKTGHDGYPLYRRKALQESGHTATISSVDGQDFNIDNRWVVPHNKVLCKMFSAHINVEFCNSVKSIQYICKYVHKGLDRAVNELARTDKPDVTTDEIMFYKTGHHISFNEAFWPIFGFLIHECEPTVIHLSVHLENGQRVYFNKESMYVCTRLP
uniref:Helitron helicase-like domain-containing protein n=1 Tax=Octopus bimaculoides TaxID=37653 RepID=A0A0L8HH64_OCTBM